MAQAPPNIGSVAVSQSGASTITAGVMNVTGAISVSHLPDGTIKMEVAGAGQGADNNAVPIPPDDEYAGGVLDREDIELLCKTLGRDYIPLGVRLEFSHADMETLEMDFKSFGYRHVIRRMMNDWRNKLARTATRALLAEKLGLIGRNDISVALLEPRH